MKSTTLEGINQRIEQLSERIRDAWKQSIYAPIINSMLDDDLYKFLMQAAIIELFPNVQVEYKYINRGKQRFNEEFLDALLYQINVNLPHLKATYEEIEWFKQVSPYMKPSYFEYLRNYRYKPNQVNAYLDKDKNLVLSIKGNWAETILWEVKLMAIISELYFKIIDKNWSMLDQEIKAGSKMKDLNENGCITTDFGTRRRRCYASQDIVVREMKKYPNFVGTSNVHLSMKHGLIPKGTQAHEWFQSMQALEGVRNSNYYGMHNWVRVYNGELGMALPDTLGTEQFLKNFNVRFSKLFDGVRWDSGDEFWFIDKFVEHYKKLKIDPMTKTIIFSNALDCERSIRIKKYCEGKIKCAFGIGTFFTGDFQDSKPLNMVIKLCSVNGIPVVKISDDKGKEMGDRDALRVAKWECFGKPLDAE